MINTQGLTEQQIEKLQSIAESMRQSSVIGGVECTVTSGNTYHFNANSMAQAKLVIAKYPLDLSQCQIEIENPIETSYWPNKIRIMYYVEDAGVTKWIWVNIPLPIVLDSLLKESLVNEIYRSPYDSEYHFFVGMSASKIKKMQILSYEFSQHNTTYYGGSCKTSDAEFIRKILDKIGLM